MTSPCKLWLQPTVLCLAARGGLIRSELASLAEVGEVGKQAGEGLILREGFYGLAHGQSGEEDLNRGGAHPLGMPSVVEQE